MIEMIRFVACVEIPLQASFFPVLAIVQIHLISNN